MAGTDAPWRALFNKVKDMHSIRARVGVLASKGGAATHPGSNMTLVEIAAVHEFGSPAANIPERSFIRATFLIRRVNALATKIADITRAIMLGVIDVQKGIGMLGAWGASEVRNTITEIDIPPPLKAATVDRKGSSKPLVDTGQLLNSITWEVVDNEPS